MSNQLAVERTEVNGNSVKGYTISQNPLECGMFEGVLNVGDVKTEGRTGKFQTGLDGGWMVVCGCTW